jgi:hypothetical protein
MEVLMSSSPVAASQLTQPTQVGRGLIGWMSEEEAKLSLAGRRADLKDRDEYVRRAQEARAAVARRPTGLDQSGVISAAPNELDAHVQTLRQDPMAVVYFNEGWAVSIVDLSKVCAAQPHIATERAIQRVENLQGTDLVSAANLSLPVEPPTPLLAGFDQSKNTWIFSSSNPNLRICGQFSGQVQPGQNVFGFMVAIAPSFLQVALYRNRYLLRDGYHRAFGLLSRGITLVPAFVKEFATYDELRLPAGMLAQDSFLGDRPPTLTDYLDDSVSAEISIPVCQKMVVIQGLEVSSFG